MKVHGKTIRDTFWISEDVFDLSKDAKLLYIYIITNNFSHFTGIYRMNFGQAGVELRMDSDEILSSFDEVVSKGKIFYDKDTMVIFAKNIIKYAIPGFPEGITKFHRIGVKNHFSKIPKTYLCDEFYRMYPMMKLGAK